MNTTKVRILDIDIDGVIRERSYSSEPAPDGGRIWIEMLAIDLAKPIQLSLDSDPPPISIYRNESWIDGRFIGMPLPPTFKRIFVLVPKEMQNG